MCGIIYSNINDKNLQSKIFLAGMLDNMSRGTDSIGFFDGKKVTKKVGSVALHNELIRKQDGNLLIGHTRFATNGSVNEKNAHPFTYNDTILVHNGVIYNHKEVNFKKLSYEVDSEVLVPIFDCKKWDLLAKVQGSCNVIAYNRKEQKTYIYKHDNPLYMIDLFEYGFIFSSTYSLIIELLDSLDIPYFIDDVDDDVVYSIDSDSNIETIKKIKYKANKKCKINYDYDDEIFDYDELENYNKKYISFFE